MNFRSRYDFVIVGGGTAGLLVAARLADNTNSTILVVETGKEPPPECRSRSGYSTAFGSHVDWDFQTTPQSNLAGRRIRWPAGKMLGGSSALNAQIYVRGDLTDIEDWAPNSERWTRSRTLTSFREFESYFGIHLHETPELQFESSNEFLIACQSAGLPLNQNFNQGDQIGFGPYVQTASQSSRLSSWSRFRQQLQQSPNVDIASGYTALKLNFTGNQISDIALQNAAGSLETVNVQNRVVITCGAVQTPALLQRSGIGNAELLKAAGIDCKIDNTWVGRNLQDHLCVPFVFRLSDPLGQNDIDRSNRCEVGGFGSFEKFNDNRAGYQIHVTPNNYLKPGETCDGHYISVVINTLRPESRGTVRIQSSQIAPPEINPNYLAASNDFAELLEAIGLAEPIFQHLNERLQFRSTKPKLTTFSDVDQIKKWIERFALTIYHPVGTCKMGENGDSVVDENLKVRGIDNCYVSDASVIPNLPRGNTQATVYMIAWQLSQLLSDTVRK